MKTFKKALACFLVVAMFLTAAPLSGFVGLQWPDLNLPEWNLPDIDFNFSADAATIVKSGTCGENLTWTLDAAGTLTISGTGDMTNYSSYSSVPWYSNRSAIKTVIIENGVTSIGSYAFYYCTSLTSVTIPDSVKSIGGWAFSDCTSLTSVTIGNSVTSIGDRAFYYCLSLTSVTIPDSVTRIWNSAFDGCKSLTSVHISDIAAWCNIDFSGSYANPLWYAHNLYLNGTLVTTLTIPDNVTSIGDYAFCNCDSLTSVTIGDSVTSIWDSAFSGCDSLTSVTIGNSVTNIGDSAFGYCYSLTSVTIPDSVTSIGEYAFRACISLTSVTIGNSVTSIGDCAFCYCTSLTSVTIPDSVTRIWEYAFSNCTSLTSVTILNPACEIYNSSSTIDDGAVIYGYTNSTAQAYAEKYNRTFVALDAHEHSYTATVTLPATCCTTGVKTYTCECEDSYTEVIPFDFTNHVGGTEIRDTVVATCTEDGYTGDTYCLGCNNIIDDGEVLPAPGHDFITIVRPTVMPNPNCAEPLVEAYCSRCGYEIIKPPRGHEWDEGVLDPKPTPEQDGILTYTCNLCWATKTETVKYEPEIIASGTCGENLTWTLDDAGTLTISGTGDMTNYSSSSSVPWYSNRSAIKTVIIENGVTSIGDYAFRECTSLTSVTIPDSVTSIGNYAFACCYILANITIPDSVTSIGDFAFSNCLKLASITIPDSVTNIGNLAFSNCFNIASITVGEGNANYSSDEYGVLFNKDKTTLILYPIGNTRTSYTIPDSVTNIGTSAFDSCDSLASITIPDGVTSIGNHAFGKCDSLASITVGEGNANYSSDEYGVLFNKDKTKLIQYPIGNTRTSYTIPDSVTNIVMYAFYQCKNLANITIPDSVTSIGLSAFEDCTKLTSVTIPNSVTSIDCSAFYERTSLASITILNPACEIYDRADTIDAGATIYGYTGSTAEEYAEKYDRTFVALAAHEHSYTSEVTLAATCCTTGVKTYTCECEDSYTEVIPFDFNNHTGGTEIRNAVKFNCITGGYTGDTYCLGCNNKIADGEIIPGTGEHTYEYKTMTEIIEIKGNNKIDLVFVVDTTGSMSGYIAAMQNGMKGYLNQLEAKDIDYRIAIVDYRDFANRGSSSSDDYPYKVQLAFTGNEDSVIAAINALSLGDGGDTDETVYSALIDGLNELSWREDAGKTVILMGDADALDPEPNTGYTLADAVESLQKDYSSPVTLFAISATGSTISTFASLATQTGGKCYTSAASLDVSEFVSDIIEVIEKTVIIPDSEWVKTKEPTCTEPGVESRTCTVCDDVQTRTIPAPGHDFVFTTEEDATCTESGYVLYTCSRCGLEKRETIQPYGHDFGSDNICDRCGFELPPEHEHSYTTTIVPPTCTEMGYTEYSCNCGYSYRTDIIEQLGHDWDKGVVTLAKTCTTDGKLTKTCTVCSATRVDPIPASHEWSETIIKAATCTEDGEKKCVCTVCGETKTEIIPAAHTWGVVTVTKAPTCTEKGKETRICSVCGTEQEFDIPALGHNFVDGVCTRCGIKFIDVITKDYANPEYGMYFAIDEIVSDYGPSLVDEYGLLLDYNEEAKFNKVAIYLTQDGTMWRRCIACTGSNITRATYVPYLAYNSEVLYSGLNSAYINTFRLSKNASGIWEYSNYATIGVNLEDAYGNLLLSLYDIGQAGAKTRIFDDLDEMKAWLEEDCENHTEKILPAVKPTCTTAGKTEGKWCPNCGQIIVKQELVPALDHAWNGGVITVPPTPEQDGVRTFTCTRCGKTKTEPVKYEAEIIASGTCGENLTWILYADGTLVISGTGDMTNYNNTDNTAPWNSYRDSIKKVIIEDGVTSIGAYAFIYCSSITTVTIGDSVKNIEHHAFYNCYHLPEITIPGNVKNIGDFAFAYCHNLTVTTISDGVASIGEKVFISCNALISVSIPASVTNIGNGAFNQCIALTEITVDGDNESYSSDTFGVLFNNDKTTIIRYPSGNSRTSYRIPDGVTSIQSCAFGWSNALTSVIFPSSVTSIAAHAFYSCNALTAVIIGDNVKTIGESAFSFCDALISVAIPDSVTSIGASAFYYCTSLTEIAVDSANGYYSSDEYGVLFNNDKTTLIQYPVGNVRSSYIIPSSVTYIRQSAFYLCKALTKITFPNPDTMILDSANTICAGATIYGYTGSTAQAYAEKYNRNFVALDEPDPHEHSYTSTVTLPATCCTTGVMTYTCECEDSYTEVIPFDFTNHTGGTEVRDAKEATKEEPGYTGDTYCLGCGTKLADGEPIPYTPEIIASGTCGENLTWILYADGTLVISGTGDMTNYSSDFSVPWYSNRSAIKTVIIENGVTSIGDWAFAYYDSLTSVTIPDSVTSIGDRAFYYCTSLTDITVDADNTTYCSEDGILFNKSKTELIQYPVGNARTSYTIPDSVTSIGNYAFFGCTSLTSVTIGNSVISIGKYAFCVCDSLEGITILNPACEIYDSSDTIDDGAVIYGHTNSTAQAYAEKYNRTFVALDAHEHSYTGTVTLPATCCTTGVKTYTCECEDSYKEVIPFDFTNHVGKTEVRDAVPATCTDGYTGDTYCLGCNTKIADGEIIPGTGAHTPDSYTEPASCTVNGYTMTFCTECGEELDFEVIPATHKWDDGIITTAATCVEEGVITYTCTVCEDTKTESTPIDPEQHTGETELRNAVPATPKQPGYSGDLYCRSCGNLLEAGVTVNLGDVDFDGKITPEDARLALREATGYKELTYAQIAAADCDRDGEIWASDSRIIMRASVGLELLLSYTSLDFELLPLDPDNNSSVSVETDWTLDHSNEIALHIYLDECVDLTSCHLQLSYDSDSFTYSDFYRYTGMDAEETRKATTNSFTWEIGEGNDGVLLLGGYFKESLWDAETFLASSKDPNDPCIVNDKKFHAFTIHLDVTDKSYLCNGTTVFVEGNLTFEQEDGTIVAIGVKNSVTHDRLDGQHYGGFGECITGTKTCSICGTKYYLLAEYHEWNEWIVVTEATFEAEGLQERTCSVCSAKETEIIPVLETKEFEDKDSGISVETDKDAYGGKDVEVKVEEVFDGSHYLGQSFGKHETWNIKTYVDGEQVQPETPVYVRIPLPEGFNKNKTFVYHINSQTGEREKMDVQVIDGYICFYTTSFSLYIVVDESTLIENPTELIIYKPYTIAKESADGFAVVSVNTTVADILAACNATTVLTATGEKADATEKLATGMQIVLLDGESVVDSIKIVVLGDIDGDGNVSSADARLALRASVKLETLNAEETLAADVEHDNTIAASDARIILRGSVNLDDPASWLMNF